ncbi:MAG: Holliday junction branch migration protein RuvA [Lachnospiraceae bacterium]|nr:Holliday junction branch migration protein RuvA [Lachnospiraceae bacterium]
MYAYFNGKVAEANADSCVLEVNNIGYNIQIPASTAERLPDIGGEVKLYTYTSVRENAIELIGFISKDDLAMFSQLITVSGIGPKAALSLLSYLDADAIRIAIVTGDVKTLSKAPGLGKKSAERLIVDLKNKYDATVVLASATGSAGGSVDIVDNSKISPNMSEAIDALSALQFKEAEARRAVLMADIDPDASVDEIINAALKLIR